MWKPSSQMKRKKTLLLYPYLICHPSSSSSHPLNYFCHPRQNPDSASQIRRPLVYSGRAGAVSLQAGRVT